MPPRRLLSSRSRWGRRGAWIAAALISLGSGHALADRPPPDQDGDNIPDRVDKCPGVPEDRDGFLDEDGCPEMDNDQDGILDVDDMCPNESEVINGIDDEDGCPDTNTAPVPIYGSPTIEISEEIYFPAGSAEIQVRSEPIIEEVAKVLVQFPEIDAAVVGHACEGGDEAALLRVSRARAEAVRARLVEHGVPDERLAEAEGRGCTEPVVPTDADARERLKNERVSFPIK